jgi:hypothetical protein
LVVSQATKRFAPLPRREQETLLVQGLLHLQHTPGGPPRAFLARGALRFSVVQGSALDGASRACADSRSSMAATGFAGKNPGRPAMLSGP